MDSSSAFRRIAEANGCWEFFSIDTAIPKSSLSLFGMSEIKSVTTGTPRVKVPVLSKAMIERAPASSK